MIKRYDITLKEQELFGRYFVNMDNSTYNFTNMFLWSTSHDIKFSVVEDCLVLMFQSPKGPLTAGYPIGPGDKQKAVFVLQSYMDSLGLNLVLRNLSKWMVDELESLLPGKFEFVLDDTASDYVYETEKLITLSGKKLHSKRNHVNYFRNTYDFTYNAMSADDIAECKAVFDKWIDNKADSMRFIPESRVAAYTLLDNFDALPVRGGVIRVGGKIVAYSVGEPITGNMALLHIEFADPDLRGTFNIINQQFCEHAWSDFKYVNREEDMGLEGLRRAKQAYRPVFMVDKYNAVWKGQ